MSNIERTSKLTPGRNWVTVHQLVDHDAGITVATEVLELPHGCLVRSTTVQNAWLGNRIAHALVFVPNMKLERHADMVEFAHKM
jgi:hypothetical protein